MHTTRMDYPAKPYPEALMGPAPYAPRTGSNDLNLYNNFNTEISPTGYSIRNWSGLEHPPLRRATDDIRSLRQTFDVKSQAKMQEFLAKTDLDNEESSKTPGKVQASLRHTLHVKPRFLDSFSHSQTTLPENTSKTEKYGWPTRHAPNTKKTQSSFTWSKEYDDRKEAAQKMEDDLRKLKEDRKRRLEGNTKQTSTALSQDQLKSQSFKKKTFQDYYSPKQKKIDPVETFEQSKTMPMKNFVPRKSNNQPKNQPLEQQPQQKQQYKVPKDKIIYQENTSAEKFVRQRSHTTQIQSTNTPPRSQKSIGSSVPQFLQKNSSVRLNDFIMGPHLGQGKFGSVYRVFHRQTGAIFALKKVPKQKIKAMKLVDQFILQLKLQTFMNHLNVLKLYKYFDDAQHIYLVLQYMEQGTLFSLLKRNKTLKEDKVAEKIRQVAEGINYLHQNDIAHRDIKPENIVMTNGVCKLADFGWATICNNRRRTCCGTFDYTPPEIMQGQEYDYTVDLWCLGVLTYELLVGKAPFYHISREETKNRIINVESTVIKYPEHLSEHAVSFIEGLIKKDPKERLCGEALLGHAFFRDVERVL